MTTEELQRLLDRSDSDKDHVRYDARDKLDDMAIDMARELIAARKVVEAARLAIPATEEPLSYHAALSIGAALSAYDQACNQSAGEGE